jgi:AcrR family transcriptional regulator
MRTRSQRELRPRKTPSQHRSRETVAAVLEAAARIFATHGYGGGTTNRIAEAAGVSIGSLYEYFPNKDALLVALMEAHIAEGQAMVERAAAKVLASPMRLYDVIRHLVQTMIDLHARDRALHRVLFEEAPLPPRVRRHLADVERRVAARVADYLRTQPEVTVPDAALAATVVVQVVEGLTHKLVVHGEREELEAEVDEMVALVTSYLTAPRAARRR